MAAVTAATISGGRLAAQGTPAPTLSVSGVGYAAWNFNLSGSQHVNAFDVSRSYVNLNAKFSGGVSTRVTSDVYRNADGSLGYRLKYGYVAYAPGAGAVTYKFGLVQTPWLSREEDLWGYRMQGSMALDRNKYLTSADFGISADTKVGGKLDLNFAIVNGEGYAKAEGDDRKDFQVRASYLVSATDDNSATGGFRISGYAGIGKPTSGGERTRYVGMVSYASKQFTLAGEYALATDSTHGQGAVPGPAIAAAPEAKGSVISAFGVYHLTNSKVALIGRVDIVDPNTDVSNDKNTRIIAGASYQVSPNLRLLGDVDLLSHEAGDPSGALVDPRNQLLFQAQFTF